MANYPYSNGIVHINKVTLSRAELVLRWATVYMYTVLVCNHPPRNIQPATSVGWKMSTVKSMMTFLQLGCRCCLFHLWIKHGWQIKL